MTHVYLTGETLAARLEALREAIGVSVRGMDAALGLKEHHYKTMLHRARHLPAESTGIGANPKTLDRIATAAAIDYSWLVSGKGVAPLRDAVRARFAHLHQPATGTEG